MNQINLNSQANITNNTPDASAQDSQKSELDHNFYRAIYALMQQFPLLDELSVSLANSSSVFYDKNITNGTKHVQQMTDELDALSQVAEKWDDKELMQQWSSWANKYDPIYQKIQQLEQDSPSLIHKAGTPQFAEYQDLLIQRAALEKNAPLKDTVKPEALYKAMMAKKNYSELKGYRALINSKTAEISTENSSIANENRIPQSLQSMMRLMQSDKSSYATMFTSFLRIVNLSSQFGSGHK